MASTITNAERIAAVYMDLTGRLSKHAHLLDIRAQIADMPREDQDAAFQYLCTNTISVVLPNDTCLTVEAVLFPDSDRRHITPDQDAAGHRIGREVKHFMVLQDAN